VRFDYQLVSAARRRVAEEVQQRHVNKMFLRQHRKLLQAARIISGTA
jgi:hypothetical protein